MTKKHGKWKSPIYFIWQSMKARCLNKNNKSYSRYGFRGIKICERWMEFEHFYADIGDPPDGMTLERKDNDGPYAPWNCRWATRKEQARNTRQAVFATVYGETRCLSEWCEHFGLKRSTVDMRINKYGWSVLDALTKPTRKVNRVY